ETLAREILLDIAARRIGIDAVELRRRNLLRRDDLPYRNPNGMTYDSISPLETFEQAIAMLDYDAFRAEQAAARGAGRHIGVGTAGSRSASMTAGAVRDTATILRDHIRAIAAHRLEAAVDDIELAESRAHVRGTPAIGISFAQIAALAYFEPSALPPGMPAGLEASARYSAANASIWVNATHVCTCEVDVDTGLVELLRYIVSEDCGPMINPEVVEGQIAGGVVQGIGGALLEHLAY